MTPYQLKWKAWQRPLNSRFKPDCCEDENVLLKAACRNPDFSIAQAAFHRLQKASSLCEVIFQSEHEHLRYEACALCGGHEMEENQYLGYTGEYGTIHCVEHRYGDKCKCCGYTINNRYEIDEDHMRELIEWSYI